jgi:hypothetical protein
MGFTSGLRAYEPMLTSAGTRQVSFLVVGVIPDMRRERRLHHDPPLLHSPRLPPATTLAAAASPSVLLIDDDIELAGLIAQLFRREGIAVQHAATGAAGLAASAPPPTGPTSCCST